MNVQTADFQGKIVRYSIVSDDGILFNTSDVCRVLGILERPMDGLLGSPCLNMTGIIEAALTENRVEMQFVEWLEANFIGYEIETPVDSECIGDWHINDAGESLP